MPEKTDKNPRYFYSASEFPFLSSLEDNFAVIKGELEQLLSNNTEQNWLKTFPDYVDSKQQKAWKVFTFLFFGMKSPKHANLCPKTAELIYVIPEIISCDYSYLAPQTHILPHKGYTRMVLRCHLPLIVPEPDKCTIRVGNETHQWEEGKLLVFDDSFEHEAWNKSDKSRVVLMFDIPNPHWGYNSDEISAYKINNLDDPFLLSLASKEQWKKSFTDRVLPMEEFF
jgi:beta-hydroxylase